MTLIGTTPASTSRYEPPEKKPQADDAGAPAFVKTAAETPAAPAPDLEPKIPAAEKTDTPVAEAASRPESEKGGEALLEHFFELVKDWLRERMGKASESAPGADPTAAPAAASGTETQPTAEFEDTVGKLLAPGPDGRVHEEELFATLVYERLQTKAGPEAAQAYLDALKSQLAESTRGDGYQPIEKAALAALKTVAEETKLDPAVADEIYSQAFEAAQLDDDLDALFDGRGSSGDESVAKADFDSAVASAKKAMAAFDEGTATAKERPLAEAEPTGGTSGDPKTASLDGFLWKPESDRGPLVILMPPSLAHEVDGVAVRGPDGQVIEEGVSSGYANGGREHWRFKQEGAAFPPNVTVEIQLRGGGTRTVPISNPAQRNE